VEKLKHIWRKVERCPIFLNRWGCLKDKFDIEFTRKKFFTHECPDLEFARSSKKTKLSHKHIVSRKKWGRNHRNWSPDESDRVLWSDECTSFLHSQHQHGVWRSPKQKYDQKYVTPTCKSHRKVNIWGAMSGTELLPFVRIEGNLNAKKSMD
jgi:hypothetical protein